MPSIKWPKMKKRKNLWYNLRNSFASPDSNCLFNMQKKRLIRAIDKPKNLCCLPGVWVPKTAGQTAWHSICFQRDRNGAKAAGRKTLLHAIDNIGHCSSAAHFTEQLSLWNLCRQLRDNALICHIWKVPLIVWIVDQATVFKGRYFVLHGARLIAAGMA